MAPLWIVLIPRTKLLAQNYVAHGQLKIAPDYFPIDVGSTESTAYYVQYQARHVLQW